MSIKETISDWFYEYSDDVYHFLVYYMGTVDVEDLVQEVFIKAMRGLKNFHHDSSPKTWLLSIARNVAIDEARRRKRKGSDYTIPLFDHSGMDETTPENVYVRLETNRELYVAIHSLKETYRDVLMLRGIQGLSTRETAQILNWKEEKVRTNYFRALKALRLKGGFLHEQSEKYS